MSSRLMATTPWDSAAVFLLPGDVMQLLAGLALMIAVPLAVWAWLHLPMCAICFRANAWRTRVVHRRHRAPEQLDVCRSCAADMDRRAPVSPCE